jgi:glutamate dehydrogenase
MTLTSWNTPRQNPASIKLAELRELIAREKSELCRQISGSNEETPESCLEIFCAKLFKRAPSEFIQRTTLETLSEIGVETFKIFHEFQKNNSPLLIKTKIALNNSRAKDVTSFCFVLHDRPFIIDTIVECFRDAQIHINAILHPILRDTATKQLISLTYIESTPLPDDNMLQKFVQTLQSKLSDLMIVTTDHIPMLKNIISVAKTIEDQRSNGKESEIANFLRWLADNGFVFLGYREWKIKNSSISNDLDSLPEHNNKKDLGLFRSASSTTLTDINVVSQDALHLLKSESSFFISKVLGKSPVHRNARMEVVTLKTSTEDGNSILIQSFLGMLTSKSATQEITSVPIARKILETLIEREGLIANSHDYKRLASIVNTIPRIEVLRSDLEHLHQDVDLLMRIQHRKETRITLNMDTLKRSTTLMVAMPRERFTGDIQEKIHEYIEAQFKLPPQTIDCHLALGNNRLARLYFFIPIPFEHLPNIDTTRLELEISNLSLTWDDNLYASLMEKHDSALAIKLSDFYTKLFTQSYKTVNSVRDAVFDIQHLENLSKDNNLEIAIDTSYSQSSPSCFDLKLYKRQGTLMLSSILPYLENTGLEIHDEAATPLERDGDIWATIYRFRVQHKSNKPFESQNIAQIFLSGLKHIITGRVDNDRLNSLLLDPGLSIKEIAIVRTLSNYLWQLKIFPSRDSIYRTLVYNPEFAKQIVIYFQNKFDPRIKFESIEARAEKLKAIQFQILQGLKNVSKLMHDRILRAMVNLIEAIIRTNAFQPENDFRIAIKIDAGKISSMPIPRPKYEIFVNSPEFEGVHLRGGKVARGGLRWSERREDFRTEILGLMKTQMIKNSIIVPVGAKGGFVIKARAFQDYDMSTAIEKAYRSFISSLLDITDNRSPSGDIVHPEHSIIYDDDDPYLVVAADKGTAVFSDIANDIAINKYNFWLGDAFASGGSCGYSHKALGITARGAWEATLQHFKEIGVDVETQTFSVVGIGDMSGDVFGNGLLLSKNAKLVAAFNHKHIFIDPNPDPNKSYVERKRLFELPSSQWTNYNKDLMSKGGGVYDRSAKEISLGTEAQHLLDITQDVISGEELIRAILLAPVDLLFNGGIGTYVKASNEKDDDVDDRVNDDVRVDARDLRAKIACEGGNCGFTQLARIEYSKIGGHINTDAVDNSGGVDLSDLEVNLKILLSGPLARGELTIQERNDLLRECAQEAVSKVIARNRSQSKVLSLGVRRSRRNIDYYRGLINDLETERLLDRSTEYLPDDESLIKRSRLKAGLTRPELAILISYTKMRIFNTLITTDLTKQRFLNRYLLNYFPQKVVERFPEDTINHPLAKEIIATQIANIFIERTGATFLYRTAEEAGATHTDIIFAFLAADEILGTDKLTYELDVMDRPNSTSIHLKSLLTLTNSLDSITRWLLEHRSTHMTWSELIEFYQKPCEKLVQETASFLTEIDLAKYNESYKQLIASGFPKYLAHAVSARIFSTVYLGIIDIATKSDLDLIDVAKLYSRLAAEFSITRLLEQARDIELTDRWEALSVRAITAELKNTVSKLTTSIIHEMGNPSIDAMTNYLNHREEIVKRYKQSVREFNTRQLTVPALLVISNQLYGISRT